MSHFLFRNILTNCNILKTANVLHINGILYLRVSPHPFSVPVSRISFCVTSQPTWFTSLIFWCHILRPVSSIMNQFFILSVQDWHKCSTTFLLHLVRKLFGSLSFLDYFMRWLVCRGLHVMNEIFRDTDKTKGPVYELPGPQMQCRGYSTHSIWENLVFWPGMVCCSLRTHQGNLCVQVLLCDEEADAVIQYEWL